MTELTITDVYAFGVPIILALILFEVLISNWQNKNYYNYGNVEDSLRIIIYKIENWEIHLGLLRESWSIDSDIKGDLMEKVSYALVRKIGEFESSKIVDIQHRRDSSSLA